MLWCLACGELDLDGFPAGQKETTTDSSLDVPQLVVTGQTTSSFQVHVICMYVGREKVNRSRSSFHLYLILVPIGKMRGYIEYKPSETVSVRAPFSSRLGAWQIHPCVPHKTSLHRFSFRNQSLH